MRGLLPLILPMLAGCAPTPQKVAMPDPARDAAIPSEGDDRRPADGDGATQAMTTMAGVAGTARAAAAPAGSPAGPVDAPVAAAGRRILSTAFVRIGPDGYLTVERRDGGVLVLRDVTMGAKDYCGTREGAGGGGQRHCGDYADVAAARPGGGPTPGTADLPDPSAPRLADPRGG